jgi:hypothetical protein
VATRLFARAIDEERRAADVGGDDRSPHETIARQSLIAEVAEFMDQPGDEPPAAVLRSALFFAPQGSVRARALRLLAPSESRDERKRLVAAALRDPSQETLIAALDSVAAHGIGEASDRVRALAVSPWPALRARAAEVLRTLGQAEARGDYSAAVLDAVGHIASQLVDAGLEYRDVLPLADAGSNEARHEAIVQAVEAYLDGVAGATGPADDGQGVLLLVAAARSRHDRLTIRLWEHESRLADCDAEMLARGLRALARARLISGLLACRQGERSAALNDLACLARLAHGQAAHDARLQAYVENAAAVSVAIWNDARGHLIEPRRSDGDDATMRLAMTVLGSLDCADPSQCIEAHRRIDSWCGIGDAPQLDEIRSSRMAN